MKKVLSLTIALLVASAAFISCSKKAAVAPSSSNSTLPEPVNTIVTTAIIDSLEKHGAVVNKGITPPTVSGIFLIHPDVCTFDDSGSNFSGDTFDDYEYKFSKQNNSTFVIRVDYLDTSNPTNILSDSTATFISGHDNLFTVYSSFNATNNGVNFVILHVLSGEVATGGIKNFQNATYIVSKGPDPNGYVESQGAIRVFYDSDLFSESESTFN